MTTRGVDGLMVSAAHSDEKRYEAQRHETDVSDEEGHAEEENMHADTIGSMRDGSGDSPHAAAASPAEERNKQAPKMMWLWECSANSASEMQWMDVRGGHGRGGSWVLGWLLILLSTGPASCPPRVSTASPRRETSKHQK